MSNNHQVSSLCNIITEGTVFVGSIVTDTDIRIDGKLEGELTAKGKVVMGEKSFGKGEIKCGNIEIFGHFEGNIHVDGLLSLHASAKLIGEVVTKFITIESGAIFEGRCSMIQEKTK